MTNKTSNYGDKVQARQFRRDMTPAEIVLWKYLRNKGTGFRFRRQHPIGPYVMDFYCYELNLCIELDGRVHEVPMADTHDEMRTDYLNQQGITVLRFSNETVYKNVDAILMCIAKYAEHPSLMKGWHKDEMIEDPSRDPL